MRIKVRIAEEKSEEIRIYTDFIRLDALLKFASIATTGGEAKIYISDGMVRVNGEVCTMRGKKIYPGDTVSFGGTKYKITAGED